MSENLQLNETYPAEVEAAEMEPDEGEVFPRWRRAGSPQPAGLRVWVRNALCAFRLGDWWTESGGRIEKEICCACPVRVACLTYALDAGEAHGIWGGLNTEQRRNLIDRLRAAEGQQAAAVDQPSQAA